MGNENNNVDKLKSEMNKKFINKVNKIIAFLEKNKIDSDNSGENTLQLLKRLKDIHDLKERNEIIDKIESIVSDVLNKGDKK
jgi:hypothetical protein